jgi:hypothetical protein
MAKYSQDVKLRGVKVAFSRGLVQLRKLSDDSDKEGYGCTLLLDKETDVEALNQVKAIILEAATNEWGDKAKQMLKDGMIRSPILDGDGPQGKHKETGEPHKGFPGTWFVRPGASAQRAPKVFDRYGKQVLEEADVPSGSIINANVNAWTWTHPKTGKGVSLNISLAQVIRKAEGDEVLGGGGGGANPESFLEKIEDNGDAPDSTKNGSGASGLFE